MRLTFCEVPNLEHVWRFQSCDFIDGFLCSCILLFWTMDVAGPVNTTYLIGYCNMNSIQRYSLLWLAWHIRAGDQYLPSINSWDSGPWKVLYAPLFSTFFFLQQFLTFLLSVCDIKNITKKVYLTNFLIKSSLFACLLFLFFTMLFPLKSTL